MTHTISHNRVRGAVYAFAVAVTFMFASVSWAHAQTLTRQLDIGARGTDVSELQTYLAQDSTIYPEGLVTGYFGRLTSAAVSRFQTRNGLPAVGRVGPQTLALLNARMGGTTPGTSVESAPIISGIVVNLGTSTGTTTPGTVSISWLTHKPATGVVYYGTAFPSMTEAPEGTNNLSLTGTTAMTDTALRFSQAVDLPVLTASTTYYYVIVTRDAAGNTQITWPQAFRTI